MRSLCSLVVINISICGDWAGAVFNSDGSTGSCSDAVSDPSNYNGAPTFLPFRSTSACTDFHCRRSDHDQLHLDLPEVLSTPHHSEFCQAARVPPLKNNIRPSQTITSSIHFFNCLYARKHSVTKRLSRRVAAGLRFHLFGIRYCWSLDSLILEFYRSTHSPRRREIRHSPFPLGLACFSPTTNCILRRITDTHHTYLDVDIAVFVFEPIPDPRCCYVPITIHSFILKSTDGRDVHTLQREGNLGTSQGETARVTHFCGLEAVSRMAAPMGLGVQKRPRERFYCRQNAVVTT
jgi:hypothetical protein